MKTGIRLKPLHFLLIILISAALLIGATFAALKIWGFRYTTIKTDEHGTIRFIGRADKEDAPISGKIYYSDGSDARIERAGTSVTFKDGTAYAPDASHIYRITYDDGNVYEGTMQGMLRHGKGSITFAGGDIYEGDFSYDEITGSGTYYFLGGDTYVGDFENGLKSGQGTYTWAADFSGKSDTYVGQYANDMRNGEGTYTWADGATYTGSYVNDAKQGEGKLTFASGDVYEGTFVDDMRTGKGSYIWKSGESYVGDFLNNAITGYGRYTWTGGSNRLSYEGYFENGKIVFVEEEQDGADSNEETPTPDTEPTDSQ